MATCAEGKPFHNSNDHSSRSGSSSPAMDENDNFSAMLTDSYVSPSEEFTHGFRYYADSPETFGMDESSRSPCSKEKDVMMSSVTSESIEISMTETPEQRSSEQREKHYETVDAATLCFTDDDQDDNNIAPLYIAHNSPKNYPITGERTPLPDINSFIRDSKNFVGIESTNCTRTRIIENSPLCLNVKTEPDVFNSAGGASPNLDEFRKDGAWLFSQNSNCRSNPCLLTYTTLTGRKPHSLSDSSICWTSKKGENGMNDYFTTNGQDSVLSSSFPRTSASKNTESACLSPDMIRDNYNFDESYKIFKHPVSTAPNPAELDRDDHLCSLEELKLNYFIPDEYYTEEELEKAIERTDIIQIKHLTPSQTEFFPNSPVFGNTKDNHFSTNGAVFNMSPVGEYTCKQELFPDREEKTLCTLDSYRGEYRVSDTPHHVKPIILPKKEPNEGMILADEIENGDLNRTETSIAVRDDQYKSQEFVENCLPASPNETSLIFTYDDNRSTYLDLENMDDMKTLILKEVAKDVDAACSTLSLSPEPTCWTEDEVQKWITWIVNRNKLPPLNASLFQVDGCQLCTMTESEMRSLAPRSGDILHAHLEIWRTVVEARSKDVSKDSVFAPTSKHTHQPKLSSKHRNEHYKTTRPIKKPKLEIGSGFSVYPSPVGSPTEHVTSPNFGFTHADISSQRHENGFRQIKEEINCGTGLSKAVPRDENPITIMTPNHTAGIHLWQFLKELLLQPQSYGQYIRWIDQERGIFKIEDSVEVARLWGIRKNRPAMNYDKLSRSIRQYYKKGIIKKTEVSQRLVYQFVKPIV